MTDPEPDGDFDPDGEHYQCARCAFAEAVSALAEAGERFDLNPVEVALVTAARVWLVDDAISGCFDEDPAP